jgi:hypothetical protein
MSRKTKPFALRAATSPPNATPIIMKKDIIIPQVKDIHIVALYEYNDDFLDYTWNVYLVNNSNESLESVMVVSSAFGTLDGEMRKTSTLRHAFANIQPFEYAKIEMIEKSLLTFTNEFMVTYFIGNTLYDKKFAFAKDSLNDKFLTIIPLIKKQGIVAI